MTPPHTVIVGAGIAGLYVGLKTARRGETVTILEAGNYLGGRIVTSQEGYEIGAGRICECHDKVQGLIKEFGLHLSPTDDTTWWMSVANPEFLQKNWFHAFWREFLEVTQSLSAAVLATHTLREIAVMALGPESAKRLLERYEYRTEIDSMRADLAIRIFRGELSGTHKFYVVPEGLSALVAGMARAIRKHRGCKILPNRRVQHVARLGSAYQVRTTEGEEFTADRVILAVTADALRNITPFSRLPMLKHLGQSRLTRIYAKYPYKWLDRKIVTDSPLRYVIPVANKWVMISYTDGRDTAHWSGLTGANLKREIFKEQHRLWPKSPEPEEIHTYPWTSATTFWAPGRYDPMEAAAALAHPYPKGLPDVWWCGESLSLTRQAWIEGALDSAESVLDSIAHRRTTIGYR